MRRRFRPSLLVFLATLACLTWLVPLPSAWAGCGCSKAPPAPAAVRPHATYAGAAVTIFDAALTVGQSYGVTFISPTGESVTVEAEAVSRRDLADTVHKSQLSVPLPDLPLGPVSITVRPTHQESILLSAADSALTAVPQPITLPTTVGLTTIPNFQGAVSRDGTVYFSLDVSAIHLPRTFKAQAVGYPLRFTHHDIVFYNTQGFVMQLLEEGMPGLFAIDASSGEDSDTLHYSRHEFNTHFLQHDERQSHEVDPTDANWHLNGTPHIDHNHLVIALAGFLADGSLPTPGPTPTFELTVQTLSFFAHGLAADTSVDLSGKTTVDSYNSHNESFGAAGDIWSNAQVFIDSDVTVFGNMSGQHLLIDGTVDGAVTTHNQALDFLPVDIPSGLEDLGVYVVNNQPRTLEPGSYRLAKLMVSNDATLFINNATGPVTLYVTDKVDISTTGAIETADPNPEKFALYVKNAGEVKLQNEATFYGVIYAPKAAVDISGNGEFFGAIVGDDVKMSGDVVVHYDAALRGEGTLETETVPFANDGVSTLDTTSSASDSEADSGTEPAPPADSVQITKAVYKNGKEKLQVYAVSDAASTAQLTVSIEGFVEAAVMTYNANKNCYEYKVSTSVNVDGTQVTVVSDLGGQASQTIR